MVQTDRYSRQELFWGREGQVKLANSTIAIIGEDSFAFPFALNSVLVGVNTRLLITGQSSLENYALDFPLDENNLSAAYETILSQINPLVRVSQLPIVLESASDYPFLDGATAIIDTTNNPNSKRVGLEFALANRIPFISTYCVPGYSIMEIGSNSKDYYQYCGQRKDPFLAWPNGALAVQEAINFILLEIQEAINFTLITEEEKESLMRKYQTRKFFLKPGYQYPFNSLENITSRPITKPITKTLEDKTALVVGAGGQGCFTIPISIMLNYGRVFYMDPQTIEEHNLSRQPFYWDSIGRLKAEVCAEKHNRIVDREVAFPLVQKFDENTTISEEVDIIYGMTDNMFSRMAMSNYAARTNKFFVSAGSDHSGADISFYVPGKTMCYTHLNRGYIESAKETERQARAHCVENPNPQVVMSNCFAGSMAVILSAYLFNNPEPFNGLLTYRPDLNPALGSLLRYEVCNCHRDGPLDLRIN